MEKLASVQLEEGSRHDLTQLERRGKPPAPRMTPRRPRFEKPTVLTTIRPDQFEPREPAAVLLQQQPGSIVVLNGGRADYDPHFA
jgi:hypothetical protein